MANEQNLKPSEYKLSQEEAKKGGINSGKAVMCENKERNAGYKFIGIEKDAEYCKIAEARIKQIGGLEW